MANPHSKKISIKFKKLTDQKTDQRAMHLIALNWANTALSLMSPLGFEPPGESFNLLSAKRKWLDDPSNVQEVLYKLAWLDIHTKIDLDEHGMNYPTHVFNPSIPAGCLTSGNQVLYTTGLSYASWLSEQMAVGKTVAPEDAFCRAFSFLMSEIESCE